MQGGFTFCGTDIAKLGIYYAPEIENTFVYGNSDLSPHEETFAAHKGGLHYGVTVQPKTFELRCFFEEENIQQGILDRVLNFFREGRTGKLVFGTRDWEWYIATVIDVDPKQLTNYRNGFITIRLKAYYPFARTDIFYKDLEGETMVYYDKNFNEVSTEDENIEGIAQFLMADQMPERSFTDLTRPKTVLLYNAGNQIASVAVKMCGKAGTNGVTIYNRNTDQEMHMVAFTRAATTNADKYVVTDSLNGKTVLTDGVNTNMMMLYHDFGFIELAPSVSVADNVHFTYHNDDKEVTADQELPFDAVGKYVFIDGQWRQIVSFHSDEPNQRLLDLITVMSSVDSGNAAYIDYIYRYSDPDIDERFIDYIYDYSDQYDRTKIILDSKPSADGETTGSVISMNEIAVYMEENDAELDELEFIYKHTFR